MDALSDVLRVVQLTGAVYLDGAFSSPWCVVVPADSPQIVVGVFVTNPRTSVYGGVVAAPVFADVAGFTLAQLGVAPSANSAPPTLFPTKW